MDENNKEENLDEVLLPGFRFHPTDEELVGFYLKRKIQQQPLSIELIKQLDIYKYDPWDLPKFASTGEKEWYFYCPRDRKYRNSARPNRVTGAGFWKATGTDRPIYSSEGNKCIGLKKSLVFYKGRAAKGVKTDWMMHEFRLPSLGDSIPSKRCIDRNLPTNDSWAICRIFKKTSPITSRALSHSWVSPSLPTSSPSILTLNRGIGKNTSHYSPENSSKSDSSSAMQEHSVNPNELDNLLQSPNTFTFLDHMPTFKPIYPITNITQNKTTTNDSEIQNFPTMIDLPSSYILPQLEDPTEPSESNIDISSMLLNMSSMHGSFTKPGDGNVDFGGMPSINEQCHGLPPVIFPQDHMKHFSVGDLDLHDIGNSPQDFQSTLLGNLNYLLHGEEEHHQWGEIQTIASLPIGGLVPLALPEAWKSSASLLWDCAPLS